MSQRDSSPIVEQRRGQFPRRSRDVEPHRGEPSMLTQSPPAALGPGASRCACVTRHCLGPLLRRGHPHHHPATAEGPPLKIFPRPFTPSIRQCALPRRSATAAPIDVGTLAAHPNSDKQPLSGATCAASGRSARTTPRRPRRFVALTLAVTHASPASSKGHPHAVQSLAMAPIGALGRALPARRSRPVEGAALLTAKPARVRAREGTSAKRGSLAPLVFAHE